MEGSRKSFETFRKSPASLKAKNHNKLFSMGYQQLVPYMCPFFLRSHFPNESTDQQFSTSNKRGPHQQEENLLTVVRRHGKRRRSSVGAILHLLLLVEQKRAKWIPASKCQVEKRGRSKQREACRCVTSHRKLPVSPQSPAPTGQTRGRCPPPCVRLLSWCCLQRRGSQFERGFLASCLRLTQSEPIRKPIRTWSNLWWCD